MFKVNIRNLGQIFDSSLIFKPLTIIIGPNNSNKTYLAHTLYGLCEILENTYYDGTSLSKTAKSKKWNVVHSNNELSIEFNNAITKYLNDYLNKELNYFVKNLSNFFQDSTQTLFSTTEINVKFTDEQFLQYLKLLSVKKYKIFFNYKKNHIDVDFKFSIKDYKINFKIYKTKYSTIFLDNNLLRKRLFYRLIERLFELLSSQAFPTPFLLPSERNTLIVSYKLLSNRRNKYQRSSRRRYLRGIERTKLDLLRELGEFSYPIPVENFIEFLDDIESSNIDLVKRNENYGNVANLLESSLFENSFTTFDKTKLGGREIRLFIKNKKFSIDLYNASSSIKQLTPLILYLKYKAKENDLLIIDEPEMNLHPSSLAKLLEIITLLVNMKLNVFLTTHSPYLMSHLNNLVLGDLKNENVLKRQSRYLYLKNKHSFIDKEKVSVYEMVKKNKYFNLLDLTNESSGFSWGSLSQLSSDINSKSYQIELEK